MFRSLASRAGLLTGAVAVIAVLVAGLVALPLIRGAAEAQVQANLSSQADLVANVATNPNDFDFDHDHPGRGDSLSRALKGVVTYMRAQGIEVQAVVPGQSEPDQLTSEQINAIASGKAVSGKVCNEGICIFVEARPVGVGTGIIVMQPLSYASSVTAPAIERIARALVIGLVISVLAGLWVARRLARPLVLASEAANELASGKRDIRLEPAGPIEVANIAIALNTLSEELAYSEGRQREFLLSVSHELRTPLTAIRGYAEALADDMVEADDLARVGSVVSAESARLDRLVSDLLDLARTGAVDFPLHVHEVDLCDVVDEAALVWADRAAREGVDFKVIMPKGPVTYETDPVRVRQLIDNLAENALRVTPEGSLIVFNLESSGLIEVRDGGPGLSDDDRRVAFQPGELFERYKGVRRVGTGFGLALVGRLASRLGAEASVGQAPEGGASFRIQFRR